MSQGYAVLKRTCKSFRTSISDLVLVNSNFLEFGRPGITGGRTAQATWKDAQPGKMPLQVSS